MNAEAISFVEAAILKYSDREAESGALHALVVVLDDERDELLKLAPPSAFYFKSAKQAARALASMHEKGEPFTRSAFLARFRGDDAEQVVTRVMGGLRLDTGEAIDTTGNLARYVHEVARQAEKRDRVLLAHGLLEAAEDGDEERFASAARAINAKAATATTPNASPIFERGPDFAERVQNLPRPLWLVPGLVLEDSVSLLHGQPRSMKTFGALEIAISVAAGIQAFHLGRFQCEAAPVIYVSEEDPEHEIKERAEGIARAHHLGAIPDDLILAVRKGVALDDDEWRARLLLAIAAMRVRLVVFDPVRALTDCVDGGPRDLKPFADFVRRIRRETRAAILLSHHDTKPNAKGEDTRDHAQQASGGGIFSISDAPIHAVRQSDAKTLLVPSAFKFTARDPEPVLVTIETSGEPGSADYEVVVTGETKSEGEAKSDELREKVRTLVDSTPCVTQNDIETGIQGRAFDIRRELRELVTHGVIIKAKKRRGNGAHYRLSNVARCGECLP